MRYHKIVSFKTNHDLERERERKYLFKMLARVILPSAISKKLREFKKRLTLKEKLGNYTPKKQSENVKNKIYRKNVD